MSELGGGTSGTARRNNGGSRPVGGTGASGGLRTPRDIMRERNAREESRQREARSRAEADDLRRMQDEERQLAADRRAATAVTAGGGQPRDSGYRSAGVSAGGVTPSDPIYTTPSIPATGAPARERGSGGYIPRQQVQSPYEASELPPQNQQTLAATARPRATQQSQQQSQPHQRTQQSQLPPQQQAPSSRAQQPTPQTRLTAATGPTSTGRGQSTQPVIGGTTNGDGAQRSSNVSSFPHAFERWETLSSRWEGLTSYWMRKLENNPAKADVNQEMARQITDLAAAGANLFHAVVELQRLRASSERKFQRWFFETRQQQENAQEDQARLRQMLEQEQAARENDRQMRTEDTRGAQRLRDNERLLQESRRELQISKDEARRAWEELGRQAQAEQDRILSLKEGHPIDIGGVQVVPHSGTGRVTNLQRSTGQGTSYQGQPQPLQSTTQSGRDYEYDDNQRPSPTDTDPFSSGARAPPTISRPPAGPEYAQYPPRTTSSPATGPQTVRSNVPTSAPSVPGRAIARGDAPATTSGQQTQSPSARFYTHEGSSVGDDPTLPQQAVGRQDVGTAGLQGSDEEDEPDFEMDDQGHVRLDASGKPIPYRGGSTRASRAVPYNPRGSASSDELDVAADIERERQRAEQYGRATSQGTTAAMARPGVTEAPPTQQGMQAEYEGTGYPEDDMEWQELQTQRHHHPTRLSNVPEEEDERSRGSMSSANRGSGGMF